MATQILLEKYEDGLHPVDDDSKAALRQIPENSIVKAKIVIPRNVRQFRLFWALINLVFEHQKKPRLFPTRNSLVAAIKIAIGHVQEVKGVDGRTYIVPDSISFGRLDNTEFREIFDASKRVVLETIVPGVRRADLDQAISDMLKEYGPDQVG